MYALTLIIFYCKREHEWMFTFQRRQRPPYEHTLLKHTRTHTHTHAHKHTRTHTHTHTHTYTCTRVCTHTHTHSHTYTCVTNTCVHTHTCIHTHTHTHTHTHAYTHTHTHIYISNSTGIQPYPQFHTRTRIPHTHPSGHLHPARRRRGRVGGGRRAVRGRHARFQQVRLITHARLKQG
jgi:hypothetical protein